MSEHSIKAPGPYVHPCHVCGAPDAPWGFAYPLAPRDQEFWACTAHRAQIEAMPSAERSELPPAQGEFKLTRAGP